MFAVLTLLTVVFCVGRARDGKPIYLPFAFPFLITLAAFALSVLYSYDVESTWLEFWGWFFTAIAFYLTVNLVTKNTDTEMFYALCGFVIIPLCLIGLHQQLTEPSQAGHAWPIPLNWEIHATLINSAVLAGFTLFWVLFFWSKKREKALFAVAIGASFLVLLMARSWLAWAIALAGLLTYHRKSFTPFIKSRLRMVLWLMLTGILLSATLYLKFQLQPAGNRLYYWETALKMFMHSPLLGVGLGGFATAYPHFKEGAVESTRFAHSFPLQLLAEAGALGLLGFLAILAGYLSKRRQKALSVGDITIAMALGFSLFSIHMEYLLNRYVFFIVMALALSTNARAGRPVRRLWLGTAACVVLLLSAFWLPLPAASRLYAAGVASEERGETEQAVALYKQALEVAHFHAESYWRLAEFHRTRYLKAPSPADQSAAAFYSRQAYRYKKSRQFVMEDE